MTPYRLLPALGALSALAAIAFAGATAVGAASAKITSADQVPFQYALGREKYLGLCAECHGEWLRGTDKGPPLLHGYYKPSHHGDRAFVMAMLRGSQQHHWQFGDMPAVEGATMDDARVIIPFVRWLQKEEGLY